MSTVRESYEIVTISDLHCGDERFDSELLDTAVEEINARSPHMVVVAGDLTYGGYREEFIEAKEYIDRIECPNKVIVPGNHDSRNVGYLHFEELFGARYQLLTFDFCLPCGDLFQENIKVLKADSSKPDLNEGEIGREHYQWILDGFRLPNEFKLFVLHHHLVSVPGTGRERNIVWDAGDVLATLRQAGVDLILCGHRHVPYAWPVADMLIVNSGTVSTRRTRGFTKPSYNVIKVRATEIDIHITTPGERPPKKKTFIRPKALPGIRDKLSYPLEERHY